MAEKRIYRIAMVCDFFYPRLGGVENHIWSLAQRLLQLGHKVIIVTHSYGNRQNVRYMSGFLKVYYCPVLPMVDQAAVPTFTATFPLMRYIFIRENIDIVHSHQATSTMANEAIVYASIMGIPTVYTDHSLFGFDDLAGIILNRVLQTTLSQVNAAICVSYACRDNLVLRAHLDECRVSVIPNAIDPARFRPDPSQRDKERIKIVVVSRLVYRKGVDLLLGIIFNICRVSRNVDFIVGGDGSKMLALQEMVERERLQDRVELLGSVPHDKVRDILVRGHIFLNCSLTESFCIAILEAASSGLLIVSTNVGGVPEVLPEDMIFLAEPTVPAMMKKLERAIEKQSGSDGVDPWIMHNRVQSMYSWSRVAKETCCIYDMVCQQQSRNFAERLAGYASLGGIAGLVACFLGLTVELWALLVECLVSKNNIDLVPDVVYSIPSLEDRNCDKNKYE